MNTALLTEVRNAILANPAAFDMEDFWNDGRGDIAGWAVATAGLNPDEVDAYTAARKLLRISAKQRDDLVLVENWPRYFRRGFEPEPSNNRELKTNARLAAKRIEHFIQTGR